MMASEASVSVATATRTTAPAPNVEASNIRMGC